jgi:hypothetical protein
VNVALCVDGRVAGGVRAKIDDEPVRVADKLRQDAVQIIAAAAQRHAKVAEERVVNRWNGCGCITDVVFLLLVGEWIRIGGLLGSFDRGNSAAIDGQQRRRWPRRPRYRPLQRDRLGDDLRNLGDTAAVGIRGNCITGRDRLVNQDAL